MKIIFTLVILLAATILQSQTTIFVKPDGTGDGTSWANACNLETAVSRSLSGAETTEIWVQKGTYFPSKMLVIPDSVKIYGGFSGTETLLSQRLVAANPTIVDGQQKIGSIFRLEKFAEINGFTIQNGNANGNSQKNGGGIWANENCVIDNCIITNNTASLNGGGVYANGKVKIINSTVIDNTSQGNGINTFGNCIDIVTNQTAFSPSTVAGCDVGIPEFGEISFKSDKIWEITDNAKIHQEWSDVVMATGCNKTDFYGGVTGRFYSDCRASNPRATYGDLFSWCAVVRYSNVLCPAPWRVPTLQDFIDLDKTLGGTGSNGQLNNTTLRNKYINSWGAVYGGLCVVSGALDGQGSSAYYWTQTWAENDPNAIYNLYLYSSGHVYPQYGHYPFYGHTLRCVK